MPLYVGQQTPYIPGFGKEEVFDAQQDFGFVGDLISVEENPPSGTVTVMTSGSPTLTLTNTAPFTSTAVDGGKRIVVQGAGGSGVPLVTTILSVTSSSVATLSANAAATVTANSVGPITVHVSFGTDNTAAINAMTTLVNTTNAAFPGVTIMFGQSATNAYGFPIPVTFNKPVQIRGIGGGYSADVGDYTRIGGTRLAWHGGTSDNGSAFQAFFTFVPTGTQALKRVAMRSCWIDCRNVEQAQALIGLKLSSCAGFILEDFFIMDALAYGLYLGIGTTPTEAKDTTRFGIIDFASRQLDNASLAPVPVTTAFLMTSAVVLTQSTQSLTVAANSLPTAGYFWTATTAGAPVLVRYTGGGGTTTLTGCVIALEDVVMTPTTVNGGNIVQATPGNGCCIGLTGGSAANTCCGVMTMLQLSHGTTWGPAAMEFLNSDSVRCEQVYINGGIATNDGVINRIRKPGVRLNGSIVSQTLASRNNIFRDGDPGVGGVSVMGLTNASAKLLAQSGPHYWDLYQLGNAAPLPVVEGNAVFDYSFNGGFRPGQYGVNSAGAGGQAVAATTATITGSVIGVPPQGFQVGDTFRWTVTLSKTAAGTTAHTGLSTVRIGTTGGTGDTAVATLGSITPTAAAETIQMIVDLTILGPLGASCAVQSTTKLIRILPTTVAGFSSTVQQFFASTNSTIVVTLATFNSTTAQQFISLSTTAGTSEAYTIISCYTEVVSVGNHS